VLAGNGPGELQGWIAPVARAARASATGPGEVRLTLALTPSQFAGGRELEVVRSWRLFDRIIEPAATIRIALGLQAYTVGRPGVLIHLGGDLLLSARLAARLGIPACAIAETTLVASRHHGFQSIFAATEAVADLLRARGVPSSRLIVTGDPRSDAMAEVRGFQRPASSGREERLISFLPGSRDRYFAVVAPFFLRTARAVADRIPGARAQFIISEFLTPSRVATAMSTAQADAGGRSIAWITEQGWAAVARSDFAVTIPGTNTLELAMAAVPFGVVLPTQFVGVIPVEGLLEWVARLPGLGSGLRLAALHAFLRKERYVAIPNRRARRLVVPEWIGRLKPADVAARVSEYLEDGTALASLAGALRALDLARPGAAAHIVREALRVASASSVA
jgi:lipid-A-disaccharide synthase